MSIEINFLTNFAKTNHSFSITKWMHDHPTALKTLQVAAVILALAAFASLPFTPLVATVALGLSGSLLFIGATTSFLFVKYFACKPHDMTDLIFTETEYKGAKLTYKGTNIPVLELKGENAKEDGEAHGFLMGKQIHELLQNPILRLLRTFLQKHRNHSPEMLSQFKYQIPVVQQLEMKGLVLGYNEWAKNNSITHRLTYEDVLLMHLIPDMKHFKPLAAQAVPQALAAACTCIVQRNAQKEVILGRNMDWCPFGTGGEKSFVIVWKKQGVAGLTFPGMVGVITGWNKDNLSLAMNVCPGETTEVRGTPAIFYNRSVLETATNVASVKEFTGKRTLRPLGPYHLTVADPENNASRISFYQGTTPTNEESHHTENYGEAGNENLMLTLNWRYPDRRGGYFNSQGRQDLLTKLFNEAQNAAVPPSTEDLVEHGLSIPGITNTKITTHTLVFSPAAKKVKMAWGNGFAASNPFQELDMQSVFASKIRKRAVSFS